MLASYLLLLAVLVHCSTGAASSGKVTGELRNTPLQDIKAPSMLLERARRKKQLREQEQQRQKQQQQQQEEAGPTSFAEFAPEDDVHSFAVDMVKRFGSEQGAARYLLDALHFINEGLATVDPDDEREVGSVGSVTDETEAPARAADGRAFAQTGATVKAGVKAPIATFVGGFMTLILPELKQELKATWSTGGVGTAMVQQIHDETFDDQGVGTNRVEQIMMETFIPLKPDTREHEKVGHNPHAGVGTVRVDQIVTDYFITGQQALHAMVNNFNARHTGGDFSPLPQRLWRFMPKEAKHTAPCKFPKNMEEILDDSKFTDADVKKLLKYYEEEPASASKNPFANRMQVMAYIGALEPGFGQIE